eukprot:TRINITY_DN22633_c0_g1_i1.p1 TRINITY_DN22633_c0_g1~~TRINITY_DN22633_c0_g1_i1.p1  ORF type:complete len:197 (+),score=27.45 TRINITY_DN22633_c0_g1_i1:107-697(+)
MAKDSVKRIRINNVAYMRTQYWCTLVASAIFVAFVALRWYFWEELLAEDCIVGAFLAGIQLGCLTLLRRHGTPVFDPTTGEVSSVSELKPTGLPFIQATAQDTLWTVWLVCILHVVATRYASMLLLWVPVNCFLAAWRTARSMRNMFSPPAPADDEPSAAETPVRPTYAPGEAPHEATEEKKQRRMERKKKRMTGH